MDTMGEEDVDGDIDDEVMGMDVVGDDDDVVGARGRRMRSALARRKPRIRLTLPRALQGVSSQGVSRPKEELDFLPFTPSFVVFGGPTTSFSEAFPQRPFRGERIIATATRSLAGVASDAAGLVVITPALFVGAVQVGASQGSTPLSAFGPTAFGVRLAVPPAGQGTRVFIPWSYIGPALPAAGDRVDVTFVIIGRAVR